MSALPSPRLDASLAAALRARQRAALRLTLLGSVAGLALCGGTAPASAQSAYGVSSDPMPLPTIAVQGAAGAPTGDYKTDQPSLPKLTEPLLNTPQTDRRRCRASSSTTRAITTFRDALRNVPGISLAAGEAGAQGDSLTIRGFTARNDIYLDGMRDFGSYYRDPFYLEDIQVLKGPAVDPVRPRFDRRRRRAGQQTAEARPRSPPARWLRHRPDQARHRRRQSAAARTRRGRGAAAQRDGARRQRRRPRRRAQRPVRASRRAWRWASVRRPGSPSAICTRPEYDIPDYGLPWIYPGTAGSATADRAPARRCR